jgi:exodeoxyribonuclease V alpha subunit
MKFIKGYIYKVCYNICEEEIEDNDVYSDINTEINFVKIEVIGEDKKKYIIKGNTIIKPDINFEIKSYVYDNPTKELNNYTKKEEYIYNCKKEALISISFPKKKQNIIEILNSLKIKGYQKNQQKINDIVDKYGDKIWNIDYKNLNDKLINKNFSESIINFIKKRNEKDSKSKQILDYLIYEHDISITKSEYKKIEYGIDKCNITFPIKLEEIEKLLFYLVGKISNIEKILDICIKLNICEKTINKIKILGKILYGINHGSTCIKEEYILKDNSIQLKDIDIIINELVTDNYISKYNNYLYEPKQYEYERGIAYNLKKYIDNNNENDKININLNEKLEINDGNRIYELNNKQKEGIYNFLNNPISIVTGGPGYGKTTIIKGFLEFIKDEDKDKIIIMGPTGKVIGKIKDDIGKSFDCIHTIHKIIHTFSTNYKKVCDKDDCNDKCIICSSIKKVNEIKKKLSDAKYIIIDELSMVSNKCFNNILEIFNNNMINANILLLGDINQLSSIDSGDVLRCLIESKRIIFTKLEEATRQQGKEILLKAIEDIKKGKLNKENDELYKNNKQFKIVESYGKSNIKEDLMKILGKLINRKKIDFKDIGILSARKDTIVSLTPDIRNYIINNGKNIKNIEQLNNRNYIEGDYIYIKVNIYIHQTEKYDNYKEYYTKEKDGKYPTAIKTKIDLFNGMFGKIEKISIDEKELGSQYYYVNFNYKKNNNKNEYVQFQYSFFNKNFINDMAYINTVHKYQGSENENIILLFPEEKNDNFVKRNLIYTAVSRAKNQCIVIGDKDAFEKCIEKKECRITQLHNMIKDIIYKDDLSDESSDKTMETTKIIHNKQCKNKDNKGIPTIGLNDINCRSKIEAIWSYVFDYINWIAIHETYNESKIKGYIPDYLIKKSDCKTIKNLYIEIKADVDFDNFSEYYQKAVDSGIEDNALLILNNGFEEIHHEKLGLCILIGKIYFYHRDKVRKSDFFLYKNSEDEWSHIYFYKKRLYNRINKKCIIKDEDNDDIDYQIINFENFTKPEDIKIFTSKINSFRNKTQWKPVKTI